MTRLPPAPPADPPARTEIPFAEISDEMLHDLATTEQIPPALYLAELARRRALRDRP